jgi:hypothetical protein
MDFLQGSEGLGSYHLTTSNAEMLKFEEEVGHKGKESPCSQYREHSPCREHAQGPFSQFRTPKFARGATHSTDILTSAMHRRRNLLKLHEHLGSSKGVVIE